MAVYRDRDVYRQALAFGRWAFELVEPGSKFDLWPIGIRLARAADSVGANIAAADGRWTDADKRRLLLIARGSVQEAEH